jgi:hypothetical protein
VSTIYTATVHGETWKVVQCEKCITLYAYCMLVEASASSVSFLNLNTEWAREDAATGAVQRLHKKAKRAKGAVPCPECGSYQRDMFNRVRRKSVHWLQIVGGLVLACAPACVMLEEFGGWIIAGGLALVGGGFIASGMFLRSRVDPNAGDPEPRKQLGRSHSVWGAKLEEMLPSQQE